MGPRFRRPARVLVVAGLCVLLAASALAQFGGRGPFVVRPNIRYDGRFTFVRLKYTTAPGGYWYGGWPAWGHGHPLAEQNLMRIMNEVTYLNPHTEEINTLDARRSGAVQVSDRLHHRGRLVGDDRPRGGCASRLSAEGRVRHRRRLQAAALSRRLRRRVRHRLGGLRGRR